MVATTPSRPCPVGRRSWGGGGEAVATSVRVSRSQSVGVRDTETGGSTLSGAWGPCPGSWRPGGEHRLPQEVGEPGRGRKGRPAWPLGVKPPFSASAGRRLGSEARLRTARCAVGLCAWATIVRAASASLSMAQCVLPSPSQCTKCCAWARAGARSTCSSRAGLGGWPGCTAGPGRHGRQAHAGLDRKREPGLHRRPHGGAGLRPRSHRGPGAAAAVCGRQSRRATRGRLAVALQVTVTEQRLGAWAGRGREAAAHSPRRSWRVSRGRGGWSCCSGTRPWLCA